MSSLKKNSTLYLVSALANSAVPFFLLPILTRVLTPADYGTVAMFALMMSILSAFTGLSVHGAISVRYFQLEKNELADYVGTCVGILVVSTSVASLLVAAFSPWLARGTGVPPDWLLLAVVASGFQFLINIRLSLWQVLEEAQRYGVFQIGQSLLNAALSLTLVLVVGMAWEGRVLGQASALLLFGAVAAWWLFRDGWLQFPRNWRAHSRDALNFGVPLIPHVIGGLLIVAADRFVIVKLLDVAQAGIYMVALQVGQILGLITESFNKAYAPWLMKALSKPTDALRISIVRGTYFYFAAVCLVAVVFGLMAPMLLDFLVGSSFRAAGELVIYIAFGFDSSACLDHFDCRRHQYCVDVHSCEAERHRRCRAVVHADAGAWFSRNLVDRP
jgi:O-antigen/teichoic acid export membrane protein